MGSLLNDLQRSNIKNCIKEFVSPKLMVLPTLVRSGQLQPPLRIFNHHSINFTISLCIKYYRNNMIVLLLMLSGHHFYHHSCKSRQNPANSLEACSSNINSSLPAIYKNNLYSTSVAIYSTPPPPHTHVHTSMIPLDKLLPVPHSSIPSTT